MRILVVEDDKQMAEVIKDILKEYYIVDLAFKGQEGEYQGQINEYDLIILDIVLPDLDGISICRSLRANHINTPILFITAKVTISSKLQAFNAGADGFITKPFMRLELLARVRALIKRQPQHFSNDVLEVDDLAVDSLKRTVLRDKQAIVLTRREFDLLEYLVRNQHRVVSRDMILEHVWEDGMNEMSNTVDVHIKYLRDKIDRPFNKPLIKTIHGVGYKIENST